MQNLPTLSHESSIVQEFPNIQYLYVMCSLVVATVYQSIFPALVWKVLLAFLSMADGAKRTEPQVHFDQKKQKQSR